ncbi:hypothetical protein ABOM_002075 [Aspergillus bombycis]|uniref:Uncharacterized protein n=1 Tax=Aspergillus bombycis TaxID=109264 RepID=A0A1F8AAF0_9EURO|nr:hypothetical protein ABOM_002075 [Aspergillus bombycis]OGM48706.1 hypothetical protein ABOM_002075 [Aspergillus bombycis]
MSLSSKIFAIRGGTSGVGAATSRLLAKRGAAAVCIADVTSQNFANLTESIAKVNPMSIDAWKWIFVVSLNGVAPVEQPRQLAKNVIDWLKVEHEQWTVQENRTVQAPNFSHRVSQEFLSRMEGKRQPICSKRSRL